MRIGHQLERPLQERPSSEQIGGQASGCLDLTKDRVVDLRFCWKMAKGRQGWAQCEGRLSHRKGSSWSSPRLRERPRLRDSRGPRRGRPGSRARSRGSTPCWRIADRKYWLASRLASWQLLKALRAPCGPTPQYIRCCIISLYYWGWGHLGPGGHWGRPLGENNYLLPPDLPCST
jgi:hypothetical protein